MSRFPFIGPTYQSRSVNVDCQRTVNLYPELVESGNGKNTAALYGTPGLSLFTTLPYGPVRGLWANEYRLFAVGGSRLYEVFAGGSFVDRGDVGWATTPVLMFPNAAGTSLFIVSAGRGYADTGTAVTDVVAAVTGGFLDGYFIAQDGFDRNQFHWSALDDCSNWDAADFASAEGYADNIRRVFVDHEDLWFFGAETTEVWRANYPTTAEGNPWERDPGAMIQQGCIAPWSVVRLTNSVAWLGGDTRGRPVAWVAQGYVPRRISTHAVEQAWSAYGDITDPTSYISYATAYAYRDQGHEFWSISFPAPADATWVYDTTTGLWHERAYWDGSAFHRQRQWCHAWVFGKHIVGDWENGKLYEMSPSYYTDAGQAIKRLRTAPHLSDEQVRHFFGRLQLDLETGEIADPTYTLEWSDDGGHTWSSAHTITAGGLASYGARAIWRRLGSSRDRVFRISSTAAMRHAWINAYLEVTKGNA